MTPYQEYAAAQLKAMGPPRHKPKNRPRTEEELEDFDRRREYHRMLHPGRGRVVAKRPRDQWKKRVKVPWTSAAVRTPRPRKPHPRQTIEQVVKSRVSAGKWKVLAIEPDGDDTRYTIESRQGTFYIWKSYYATLPPLPTGSTG